MKLKTEDYIIDDLYHLIDVIEIIKNNGLAFVTEGTEEVLTGYDLLSLYYVKSVIGIDRLLQEHNCEISEEVVDNIIENYMREVNE